MNQAYFVVKVIYRPKQTILSNFLFAGYGYASKAPAIFSPGVGDYLCAHHALLANAAVYHMYKEKYFARQRGQVGICLTSGFNYPDQDVDPSLAEKAMEFDIGRFGNPIFSREGGYPKVLVDQINTRSAAEGRKRSRLPTMTKEEKKKIRGTSDFLALNYYTSRLTKSRQESEIPVSWWDDSELDGPSKFKFKIRNLFNQ